MKILKMACISMLLISASAVSNEINLNDYWCEVGHLNFDQAYFLKDLLKIVQPKYVLETGFCTGRSTATVLTSSNPVKFISVDIDLNYRKPYGHIFARKLADNFKSFSIIEGDSKKIFTSSFFNTNFPNGLDWITIDGDHTYKGCLNDLKSTYYLNNNGVAVIDDYNSSKPNGKSCPEVTRAVDVFCEYNSDFYKIVWFNKGKGFAILTKNVDLKNKIESLVYKK